MAITLPDLPYAKTALAPHLSAETLELHHDKHHAKYVKTVNELIAGKPEDALTLEQLIAKAEGKLFNNAAQVWNHSFYWRCMKPSGGGAPPRELADALARDFGSVDKFQEEFRKAAESHFGSGWAWLVLEKGKLAVVSTHDGDLPLKHGQQALLTIDVWEHAYYVDYRNDRPKYVQSFLNSLVNWEFVLENLKSR